MERQYQYPFMIGYLQGLLIDLIKAQKIDKASLLSLKKTIEEHEVTILSELKRELDKL